jgi:hypothetical protein
LTESRSTPASSKARRTTDTAGDPRPDAPHATKIHIATAVAGSARVRLDEQVIELFEGAAHECRNGDLCPRCRGDVRDEAFQWLRDLAGWDAPQNDTLLEFRRWERHILHDRNRGPDPGLDPEPA